MIGVRLGRSYLLVDEMRVMVRLLYTILDRDVVAAIAPVLEAEVLWRSRRLVMPEFHSTFPAESFDMVSRDNLVIFGPCPTMLQVRQSEGHGSCKDPARACQIFRVRIVEGADDNGRRAERCEVENLAGGDEF